MEPDFNERQRTASILIVDDMPANLNVLCGILRESGYRARPVTSGELALQAARASPPDLVLLDIAMPDMTGYEVCERLKADPALSEIPVIFISALTDVWDKVKAFAVGGVDYISKPFQLEEVRARVATHLEVQKKRRELEQSLGRLRELEKLRDNLVHMVVHDMRSPLTALMVHLNFLREGLGDRGDPQAREDVDAAVEAAKRVNDMANDLLDVSRLEAGQMPLEREPCDLAGVIGAAMAGVGSMFDRREVNFEPAGSIPVICDGSVIRRVVENLLSNGLKHTPTGSAVEVSATTADGWVRVSVRDHGAGIAAGFHQLIFEKFGVVEGRTERKYHSAGLGLAFCKLAVEAHGGHIGVESAVGYGSTFTFTLPRSDA